MKGRRDHEITQNPNNMFQKFHHPQQHHHHYQQQQQLHHQQQLSRDQCQTSEEDDCRSNDNNSTINLQETTKKIKKDNQVLLINNNGSGSAAGCGDGATIEVVRRPRGRPPGSKNRPKPTVVITRNIPTDDECAMRPHVLEIPIGVDIINAVTRFSRQHNICVCVLSGSGTVANVSLHQPSTTPGATVTFHGRFEILSISATFVPPSSSLSAIISGFSISLAGPQGQIFGGSVVGSLVAASTVFVVASSFNNPSFHRLPVEDDDNEQVRNNNNNSSVSGGVTTGGGGGVGSEERDSHSTPQPTTSPPQNDQHQQSSCSMSMYHLPNDVIWAPTPRQQFHPLPPY